MALAAASVFEVQTGGAATNGGGFVTGASGTDYSQVAAKRTGTGTDDSTTDAVANGTTTITSATANFQTSIVGNIIYLQGGTGAIAAGWYQVTARTNATTITIDRTIAASTGMTMNIGGALSNIGTLGGITTTSGNKAWIKTGTYTVTSATNNISGGTFSKSVGMAIEGYGTTRGDLTTPPTFNTTTANVVFFTNTGAGSTVTNIIVDGQNTSNVRGYQVDGVYYKCTVMNCKNGGFTASTAGICVECYGSGCSVAAAFQSVSCFGCVATGNLVTPFNALANSIVYDRCISYGNTVAGTRGFIANGVNFISITNCVAYNNTGAGFYIGGGNTMRVVNCIAEANGANGFDIQNVAVQLINCAAYNNTGSNFAMGTSLLAHNRGSIIGAGTFFTNAGTGDFSLNASDGAALKATACPVTVFPGGQTPTAMDIGAAQVGSGGGAGGQRGYSF